MSITAYKCASSSGKRVLITLEIPEDALTNMERKSVAFRETAKYRANKALVTRIEDADGNTYESAKTRMFHDKTLTYEVGKMVEEPSYNKDLEKVCAEGIHFFLNRRVAELYGRIYIENGLFESWHDNGQKESELLYVNGEKQGFLRRWYENGQKECEILFLNGKIDGMCQYWFENGQKQLEYVFRNEKMEGLYQGWHDNGQKAVEEMYVNGVREGLVQQWDKEGNVLSTKMYKSGVEVT